MVLGIFWRHFLVEPSQEADCLLFLGFLLLCAVFAGIAAAVNFWPQPLLAWFKLAR